MRRLLVADAVRTAAGSVGDAVLVEGDTVVAVGAEHELAGGGVEAVRYRGVIVPALEDAHLHPGGIAGAVSGSDLGGPGDLDALRTVLRERAALLPPGRPLVASGLDEHALAEGVLPDRSVLDDIVPDRPVVLHRVCGHVAVVNRAALEAAGLGPGTPDPAGGALDRDERGEPTGVLRETAIDLVRPLIGAPGSDTGALRTVLDRLARSGLGAVGAMVSAGAPLWCGLEGELDALAAWSGTLPLDVRVFVMTDDPGALSGAARTLATPHRDLTFAGWKGFADGSFGGHTAALRAPYADRPDTSGLVRLEPGRSRLLAETSLGLGGWVAIHAIGDRAVDDTLGLFAALIRDGADPSRLRVEHASLVDEALVRRMAELGVVASVQPSFVPSDAAWIAARVGPVRARFAYPFRSMLDAGVRMVGGSDAPVEDPDPWAGMAAARHRGGFHPEESLEAGEALALFTGGSGGADRRLTPGSPADLLVVDRDPVAVDAAAVASTRVLARVRRGVPADPDDPGR